MVCIQVVLALHHCNCVFATLSSVLVRKPTKPQITLAIKRSPQKATANSIILGIAGFEMAFTKNRAGNLI